MNIIESVISKRTEILNNINNKYVKLYFGWLGYNDSNAYELKFDDLIIIVANFNKDKGGLFTLIKNSNNRIIVVNSYSIINNSTIANKKLSDFDIIYQTLYSWVLDHELTHYFDSHINKEYIRLFCSHKGLNDTDRIKYFNSTNELNAYYICSFNWFANCDTLTTAIYHTKVCHEEMFRYLTVKNKQRFFKRFYKDFIKKDIYIK